MKGCVIIAKSKKPEIDLASVKEAVRRAVESAVSEVDFSRLTYDAAGKPLVEGIAVGIRDNAYMASDAMKSVMKELDLQLSLGAISNEKYYKYMEAYRDAFFEKGSSGWWDYTSKILEYEGVIADGHLTTLYATEKNIETEKQRIIEVYTDLISQAKTSAAELERSVASMRKNLDNYYSPYSTTKFRIKDDTTVLRNGVWVKTSDIVHTKNSLTDLNKINSELENYLDMLMQIKEGGAVPSDFFRYLRSLPVEEGMNLANLLISEGNLDEFAAAWENLQNTEKTVVSELFADEVAALSQTYGNLGQSLKDEIENAVGSLPKSFFKNGELSAEEFGKGFTSALYGVMEDINRITADISINTTPSYNANYNFYGSGQTVAQQLAQARVDSELAELRGGI